MSSHKANILGAIGASGSGKSHWIKTELLAKRPRRLLIWDSAPLPEYGAYAPEVRSMGELCRVVGDAGKKGAFAVRFVPEKGDNKLLIAQFNVFCGLAMHEKIAGGMTVIAEELSQVTRAGWAPINWQNLCTAGRHMGCTVIGVTQRPALVDKTFFGNCTRIRVFRLNYAADKKVMADALDVEKTAISGLSNHQWIEKDMFSGKILRSP